MAKTSTSFKKGNPGKPKGAVSNATKNAREAIAALVDLNLPRMQEWLDEICEKDGPAAAWKCMQDVIEYHIPKLSRTEVNGNMSHTISAAQATDDLLAHIATGGSTTPSGAKKG